MKVKLETAYDDFDLYSITLGQGLPAIYKEAFGFVLSLEMYMPKRCMSVDGVSVLEIMAGANSTHSQYIQEIMKRWNFNLKSIRSLDSVSDDPNVKKADVRTFELGETFDAIAGFYYALGAIIPTTRESAVAALRQSYKHLNKGGLFFTTFLADAYHEIIEEQEDSVLSGEERTYDIPPSMTRWRNMLGIPFNKDPLELVGTMKETYDRRTGLISYHYHNFRVVSKHDDTVYIKFKIRRPITIRYWSEPEIADMAAEAGFPRDGIYFQSLDEDCMYELDRVLDFSLDEVEQTPANAVVLLKDA